MISRFETFALSDQTFFVGSLFVDLKGLVLFSAKNSLSSSGQTTVTAAKIQLGVIDLLSCFVLESRPSFPSVQSTTFPKHSEKFALLF